MGHLAASIPRPHGTHILSSHPHSPVAPKKSDAEGQAEKGVAPYTTGLSSHPRAVPLPAWGSGQPKETLDPKEPDKSAERSTRPWAERGLYFEVKPLGNTTPTI